MGDPSGDQLGGESDQSDPSRSFWRTRALPVPAGHVAHAYPEALPAGDPARGGRRSGREALRVDQAHFRTGGRGSHGGQYRDGVELRHRGGHFRPGADGQLPLRRAGHQPGGNAEGAHPLRKKRPLRPPPNSPISKCAAMPRSVSGSCGIHRVSSSRASNGRAGDSVTARARTESAPYPRDYSRKDDCFGCLAARRAASSSGEAFKCRGGRVTRDATAASRSVTMRSQIFSICRCSQCAVALDSV